MARKTAIPLDHLLQQIQTGTCPSPILLQGDEDYRVDEARRRILAALFPDEEERKSGVETVSAKDTQIREIVERASASPLFAARQALVVRDAELLAKVAKSPARGKKKKGSGAGAPGDGPVLAGLPPDAVLILVAQPTMDRRTRLFKEIEARGAVLTFPRITRPAEISDWIDKYLRYRKKEIAPAARALLIQNTVSHDGVSLRLLVNELDKLSLYAGERDRIEREDVEALVGRSAEEMIFALTNALAERSAPRVLARLAEFLDRGEAPLGLLALLARELRNLLEARIVWEACPSARDAGRVSPSVFEQRILPRLREEARRGAPGAGASLLARKPYAVYIKMSQVEKFTREELLRGVELAASADRELKSSGRSDRLVMEDLLLRLAGVGA